jgi:dihydropteroate synthase
MGVVNVTPDSFSDGGRWLDPQAAVLHGLELLEQGADLLDVGGESTRPGAARVAEAEELARVLPVVKELARAGAWVSIDTMRAAVAAQCVEVGAAIVNDVSGGLADPDMLPVVAELNTDYVCQHWRGLPSEMDARAGYGDVVEEVVAELLARRDAATAAGIAPGKVILDPGLGFAKRAEDDWEIVRHVGRFVGLGHRVLLGASRKRFLAGPGDTPEGRDAATAAVSALAAAAGVWAVRVHDPGPNAAAVRVAERVRGHEKPASAHIGCLGRGGQSDWLCCGSQQTQGDPRNRVPRFPPLYIHE